MFTPRQQASGIYGELAREPVLAQLKGRGLPADNPSGQPGAAAHGKPQPATDYEAERRSSKLAIDLDVVTRLNRATAREAAREAQAYFKDAGPDAGDGFMDGVSKGITARTPEVEKALKKVSDASGKVIVEHPPTASSSGCRWFVPPRGTCWLRTRPTVLRYSWAAATVSATTDN
jgi:hypothetical protein